MKGEKIIGGLILSILLISAIACFTSSTYWPVGVIIMAALLADLILDLVY